MRNYAYFSGLDYAVNTVYKYRNFSGSKLAKHRDSERMPRDLSIIPMVDYGFHVLTA